MTGRRSTSTESHPEEPDDLTAEERNLAGKARAARPPDLPEVNVERIERRILVQFERQKQARRGAVPPALARLALALASAAVMLAAGAGVVAAAATSLPGETLYPIKRFTENIQLAIVPGPERPGVYADMAAARLTEVETLAARGAVEPGVVQAMADTTEQAVAAAETLSDGPKTRLLARLVDLSTRQQAALEVVRAKAQAPAQTDLAQAAQTLKRGHDRAESALSSAGGSLPASVEPAQSQPATAPPTATPDPAQLNPPRPSTASGQESPTARSGTQPAQPHGQDKTPPGQDKTPPGQDKTPPGHEKTPPPDNGGGKGHAGKP
jgi:hypothetical protein